MANAGGCETGPATDAEVASALAVLAQDRGQPYLDAFDLVPERADMAGIERIWRSGDLRRERRWFASRRDGRTLAVAAMEVVDEGVHLYGLLDTLRLVPLTRDGLEGEAALLEEGRRWFGEHGRPFYIYWQEYGDLDGDVGPGLTDLGRADIALTHVDLLPDLLEHIWELTATGK